MRPFLAVISPVSRCSGGDESSSEVKGVKYNIVPQYDEV